MSSTPSPQLSTQNSKLTAPHFSGLSFDGTVVCLLAISVFTIAALMPMQSDSWWHLRVGQEICMHGTVPVHDALSYTSPPGYWWPNHEWLSQVFIWQAFTMGGLPLVNLLAAGLVTVGVLLGLSLGVGKISHRVNFMMLALPVFVLGWTVRPQIFTFLALPLAAWLLVRERYLWLPVVFLVWANLHGGVVLGGLTMLGACLAALFFDRKRLLKIMLWTFLCGLATLLTPLGWHIAEFPIQSVARLRAAEVEEWRTLGLTLWPDGYVWLTLAAFVGLLVWKRQRLADWPDRLLAMLATMMVPMSILNIRNAPLFLLLAVPAVSRLLNPSISAGELALPLSLVEREVVAGATPPAQYDNPTANLRIVVVFAILAAGFIGWSYHISLAKLEWQPISAEAIRTLHKLPGPLYNTYNNGGYILFFAPAQKVFIDSRQDPYPLDFLLEALRVEKNGNYDALLARWGFQSAVLHPKSLTGHRLSQKGWQTTYLDEQWWMLTRPVSP